MFLLGLGGFLKMAPDVPLQTILKSSSEQAEEINRVTNYFFLAAGCMLLVVAALTAYVIHSFSARRPPRTVKPLSQKWEILMIGFPTVLVAVFFILTITTMNKVQPAVADRTPDIVITAHQWWWEAAYPAAHIATANEIHMPSGKKLLLKLLSADVIHDWWVPSFGNKMDLVPSDPNYLWVTVKEPGVYHGICSEFCGSQHAHMRIRVIAEQEEAYENWLKEQQQPVVAQASLQHGEQLFMSKTCGNCHRIAGSAANGSIGPDLTHLARRQTLLAGVLENNPSNLEQFIRAPQQTKPGILMPDFLLDDTTVKALTAYLYSLK